MSSTGTRDDRTIVFAPSCELCERGPVIGCDVEVAAEPTADQYRWVHLDCLSINPFAYVELARDGDFDEGIIQRLYRRGDAMADFDFERPDAELGAVVSDSDAGRESTSAGKGKGKGDGGPTSKDPIHTSTIVDQVRDDEPLAPTAEAAPPGEQVDTNRSEPSAEMDGSTVLAVDCSLCGRKPNGTDIEVTDEPTNGGYRWAHGSCLFENMAQLMNVAQNGGFADPSSLGGDLDAE